MVVKVYVSGISGNKEVKKHQQRVLMILDSKNIEYVVVDITEPGKENEKEFMQQNGKANNAKYPLPPQLFNEDDYCGGYEDFDLANEIDNLETFLKLPSSTSKGETPAQNSASVTEDKTALQNGEVNGTVSSRENSVDVTNPVEKEEIPSTVPEGQKSEEE